MARAPKRPSRRPHPPAATGPGHDPERLRALLDQLRRGEATTEQVLQAIQLRPFVDLGFARLDTHRHLRKGFPEVVLGLGKTRDEIVAIVAELGRDGAPVLVTKTTAEVHRAVRRQFPHARFAARSGLLLVARDQPRPIGRGIVLVVSAGTSDGPVAEEAALTATAMGNRVETLYDVGVAGIHRLLAEGERLVRATVVIVVAGMEGALPSVVAGIVRAPVIAVPTSTGYGTSFGGVAALLGMLNSCASGVTVVNIDNGFGAAYAASLINRHGPSEEPARRRRA